MRATTVPLEANRVRVTVDVDEADIDGAVQETLRRLGREVRVPGFRPGKVPRRVLEARLGGAGSVRRQAIRDLLPDLYAEAVRETEIDPIAAPELDITAGEDAGPLSFDAVVEVRPTVAIPGYEGLVVTVPSPVVPAADVDARIDRLREQFGELVDVGRPAADGDHVTIDISAKSGEKTVDALGVDDLVYEVGSGHIVGELDKALSGAKPGDILAFDAPVPAALPGVLPERTEDAGQDLAAPAGDVEVAFRVLVKKVREKKLPELTDAWVAEASELSTVDELRTDVRRRLAEAAVARTRNALRSGALSALVALVVEDVPDVLVSDEAQRRYRLLGRQLESQRITLDAYLQLTGREIDAFDADMRAGATEAVKADLALRSLADAIGVEVTDDDVRGWLGQAQRDFEIARDEQGAGEGRHDHDHDHDRREPSPEEMFRRLEHDGGLGAVRSDLAKDRALAWLVDHVGVVDEDGNTVDRELMAAPGPNADGSAHEEGDVGDAIGTEAIT